MPVKPDVCVVDFETASEVDLRDVGVWKYAEHPSTQILCLAYKINNGQTELWIPTEPFPAPIIEHVENNGIMEAHNAMFEQAIWLRLLVEKMSLVKMPLRWMDTMAVCAYRGLPLSLDTVGDVLDLATKKDKRGKLLLNKLAKPKKLTKTQIKKLGAEYNPMDVLWDRNPELMRELYEYCVTDVDTEYALSEKIRYLPKAEQEVWLLDQVINARGIKLDVEGVESGIRIAESVEEKLTSELAEITDGKVRTGSEIAKMRSWLAGNGVYVDSLTAEEVQMHLTRLHEVIDENPDTVEYKKAARVLEIRQTLSKAAVKKFRTMLDWVCSDGRIRGMLQYHGAQTGRWAGRGPQPQNMFRGKIKDVEELVWIMKMDDPEDDLKFWYQKDIMEILASSLRSMFIAEVGKVLRVSDFSAIEARLTMFVAGQQDMIDAFHRYDRGEGPDIYCVQAEKMYGHPVDKAKEPDKRQGGKVAVLSCGYGVGPAKLQYQARVDYGLNLDDDQAAWVVSQYREQNNKVVETWYGLHDAAVKAILTDQYTTYKGIGYGIVNDNAGRWLACVLPNNKKIWYYKPQANEIGVTGYGRTKYEIVYEGKDNKKGGKWGQVRTYGGMMLENVIQALARECMVNAMLNAERAGYPLVLTVHDELVAEDDPSHGSDKEFDHIMKQVPSWLAGCPLGAEGWSGTRYRKA